MVIEASDLHASPSPTSLAVAEIGRDEVVVIEGRNEMSTWLQLEDGLWIAASDVRGLSALPPFVEEEATETEEATEEGVAEEGVAEEGGR